MDDRSLLPTVASPLRERCPSRTRQYDPLGVTNAWPVEAMVAISRSSAWAQTVEWSVGVDPACMWSTFWVAAR